MSDVKKNSTVKALGCTSASCNAVGFSQVPTLSHFAQRVKDFMTLGPRALRRSCSRGALRGGIQQQRNAGGGADSASTHVADILPASWPATHSRSHAVPSAFSAVACGLSGLWLTQPWSFEASP